MNIVIAILTINFNVTKLLKFKNFENSEILKFCKKVRSL